MAFLIGIPILATLVVFQSAILSRVPLLHGTADLLLLAIVAWALQKRVQTAWHWSIIAGLIVTFTTALPFGVPLAGYLLATGVALVLRHRIWQAPILAMFVATFAGTVITQGIDLFVLRTAGWNLPLLESFNLVTLPSLLLNLLFAIPMFAILSDLASWLYPEELEV